MGIKKVVSKEIILEEYINKDVSMRQACDALGICPTTMIRSLREYGINPKPRTWNHRRKNRFPLLQDREWLREQMQTKSLQQIAHELGTSQGNVSDHAKRHGIRSRFADRNEAVMEGLRKRFPNGRFGELATNWKGGRRETSAGHIYLYQPDHRSANKAGYVMEHRVVMEQHLGRLLTPDEVVHHKNGKKDDNRIENLEVLTKSQHVQTHFDAVEKVHELEQENERLKARIAELERS